MSRFDRPFQFVSDYSKLIILLFLIATLFVGAGVAHLQTGTEFQQYRGTSDAAAHSRRSTSASRSSRCFGSSAS